VETRWNIGSFSVKIAPSPGIAGMISIPSLPNPPQQKISTPKGKTLRKYL
jgi:hypothetical protein